MVRARIINNADTPGEMEWMNIRRNIMNTRAKIKNIVDFASRTEEMRRIKGEKAFQLGSDQKRKEIRVSSKLIIEGLRGLAERRRIS